MRGAVNRLSDTRLESIVRTARKNALEGEMKPKVVADGGGLYLQLTRTGTASWLFRYTRHKRAVGLGLGGYPEVGLKAARIRATECREHLEFDRDPKAEKRKVKVALQLNADGGRSFDQCAKRYIDDHRPEWRNAKHAQQWENTLRTYASPIIGARPIAEVCTEEVRRILHPIWLTKSETARRLRGRIESIMNWATVHGFRAGDNPARLKGHLEYLLPRLPAERRTRKHFASYPFKDMPAFMQKLHTLDGVARWALEFLILTAARTSEVTGAVWSEFNLEERIWLIPAERMKAGKDHRVPLCDQAIDILKTMQEFDHSGKFVFFGRKKDRPLSNMAMSMLLRRAKFEQITVHGFRSSFRDWVSETTDHDSRVAEAALAHSDPNKVRKAYMRGDLWQKRERLMRDWAQFCYFGFANGMHCSE